VFVDRALEAAVSSSRNQSRNAFNCFGGTASLEIVTRTSVFVFSTVIMTSSSASRLGGKPRVALRRQDSTAAGERRECGLLAFLRQPHLRPSTRWSNIRLEAAPNEQLGFLDASMESATTHMS
jgi:hypothetical protein